VIGCEDCLQNDLYCVRWGIKLYSVNQFIFDAGLKVLYAIKSLPVFTS